MIGIHAYYVSLKSNNPVFDTFVREVETDVQSIHNIILSAMEARSIME